MPVQIGELSSDVTLVAGDLPLGEAQMEKIAQFVLARLRQQEREGKSRREATEITPGAAPPAE
jgi:hypothetical protein